jgi:hypothetical protein
MFVNSYETKKVSMAATPQIKPGSEGVILDEIIISIYMHLLRFLKKLFCAFVDFSQCFNKILSYGLWHKLRQCSVNGNVFQVIFNMYQNIKIERNKNPKRNPNTAKMKMLQARFD